LLIYQRDQTRTILDIQQVIQSLQTSFNNNNHSNSNNNSNNNNNNNNNSSNWEIQMIYHENNRSPCELAHIFYNVDVLLTSHGFQSMLMLLLPIPSIFIEIFPALYYKSVYHKIALSLGLVHLSVPSTPTTTVEQILLSLFSYSSIKYITNHLYFARKFARQNHVR
jgi:hypothetical protein